MTSRLMRKPSFSTILLFVLGLVLADRALGFALDRLTQALPAASSALRAARQTTEMEPHDVVVFGSSRALHHFRPATFFEASGLSSQNLGVEGQDIRFSRILGEMLLARSWQPKLIVLQFDPLDLCRSKGARATALSPLYGKQPAVRAFLPMGELTRIKLESLTYRHNSQAPRLLKASLSGTRRYKDGYEPLHGTIDPVVGYREKIEVPQACERNPIRSDQEALIRGFLSEAKKSGVPVVIFQGPRLRHPSGAATGERRALEALDQIAREEGAFFIPMDENQFSSFDDPALYKDPSHLNDAGAVHLTALLATEIRKRLPDVFGN